LAAQPLKIKTQALARHPGHFSPETPVKWRSTHLDVTIIAAGMIDSLSEKSS
jgi:hypothetical protein